MLQLRPLAFSHAPFRSRRVLGVGVLRLGVLRMSVLRVRVVCRTDYQV